MITATHALVYSDDATATRAFFKDVLQWPFVSEGERGDDGTGGGTGGQDPADWLIFGTGPGAAFAGDAEEMGFGRGIALRVPGADDMLLYQPHHATAYELG